MRSAWGSTALSSGRRRLNTFVSSVEKFKEDRKESLNDVRLLGDHRDAQGKRHLSLNDGLTLMAEASFEDWAFSGPRSTKEYLQAIRSGPWDIPSYHLGWIQNSGVATSSAIAHKHRSLLEILRLAISRDQVDVSSLCSFEALTRRLVTLEIAVARSPGAPDCSGLEVVSEAPISSQGQAHVSSMNAWITEKLKEKAQVQKQARLFREEFKGRGPKKALEDGDDADHNKRWSREPTRRKAEAMTAEPLALPR